MTENTAFSNISAKQSFLKISIWNFVLVCNFVRLRRICNLIRICIYSAFAFLYNSIRPSSIQVKKSDFLKKVKKSKQITPTLLYNLMRVS